MQRAHLISFGLAGHLVYTSDTWKDGCRVKGQISGYDTPESFVNALSRGEKSSYPPLGGVPVLDKRAVLRDQPALAIKSPLVDVDLEDGAIDRIDTGSARALLPGLSGQFETLAGMAIVHALAGKKEPGPLDSISLATFIEWWTSRGARLGHMDDDGLTIIWNDKEEER